MKMNSYSCCSAVSDQSKRITKISSLLQLVSEGNKLQILCILKHKEHCVCELRKHIGISQSLLSHHLKCLKDISMVEDRKQGLRVYYKLTKKGKQIVDGVFSII